MGGRPTPSTPPPPGYEPEIADNNCLEPKLKLMISSLTLLVTRTSGPGC